MCIFTAKTMVKYFTHQNTSVYTCWFDASKVLDGVNYWSLLTKYIDSDGFLSGYLIQQVHVCNRKWGK